MKAIWLSFLGTSLLSLRRLTHCSLAFLFLTWPCRYSSSWIISDCRRAGNSVNRVNSANRIKNTANRVNSVLRERRVRSESRNSIFRKETIDNLSDGVDCVDCVTGTTEESNITSHTSQVYLRFSPLVGGPRISRIIPIHVEVMILTTTSTASTVSSLKHESNFNHLTVSNSKICQCLHRFDFLPAHPTETATIQKLLSFQSVPGLVRHRIFVNENLVMDNNLDNYLDNNLDFEHNSNGGDHTTDDNVVLSFVPSERIQTLVGNLFHSNQNNGVFSIQKNDKNNRQDSDSGLSIAIKLIDDVDIQFKKSIDSGNNELYKLDLPLKIPETIDSVLEASRRKQLHLIENNCYSFSWKLLNSLRS